MLEKYNAEMKEIKETLEMLESEVVDEYFSRKLLSLRKVIESMSNHPPAESEALGDKVKDLILSLKHALEFIRHEIKPIIPPRH